MLWLPPPAYDITTPPPTVQPISWPGARREAWSESDGCVPKDGGLGRVGGWPELFTPRTMPPDGQKGAAVLLARASLWRSVLLARASLWRSVRLARASLWRSVRLARASLGDSVHPEGTTFWKSVWLAGAPLGELLGGPLRGALGGLPGADLGTQGPLPLDLLQHGAVSTHPGHLGHLGAETGWEGELQSCKRKGH